jgi:hypothetical protein
VLPQLEGTGTGSALAETEVQTLLHPDTQGTVEEKQAWGWELLFTSLMPNICSKDLALDDN